MKMGREGGGYGVREGGGYEGRDCTYTAGIARHILHLFHDVFGPIVHCMVNLDCTARLCVQDEPVHTC